MASRSIGCRRIIIDLLCFGAVGTAVLLVYLLGKPYRRGFFCNDESIRHPYPKSITVTDLCLTVVGIGTPIIVILTTELVDSGPTASSKFTILGKFVPLWMARSYEAVGVFMFGCGLSQITVDVAKYLVGRLRPHFISVCLPDVQCDSMQPSYQYVTEYQCTGTDKDAIDEARLSFPSGHSALSFYAATFTVMYLQAAMTWRGSHLLRHVLQFACVVTAWFTALSRISDYMHHWSDVLAGMSIGTLTAVLVVCFVSTLRCRRDGDSNQELMGLMSTRGIAYVPQDVRQQASV